jgi:hypothetical protein
MRQNEILLSHQPGCRDVGQGISLAYRRYEVMQASSLHHFSFLYLYLLHIDCHGLRPRNDLKDLPFAQLMGRVSICVRKALPQPLLM